MQSKSTRNYEIQIAGEGRTFTQSCDINNVGETVQKLVSEAISQDFTFNEVSVHPQLALAPA